MWVYVSVYARCACLFSPSVGLRRSFHLILFKWKDKRFQQQPKISNLSVSRCPLQTVQMSEWNKIGASSFTCLNLIKKMQSGNLSSKTFSWRLTIESCMKNSSHSSLWIVINLKCDDASALHTQRTGFISTYEINKTINSYYHFNNSLYIW